MTFKNIYRIFVKIKKINKTNKPMETYKFSEITYKILKKIVDCDLVKNQEIFKEWFNFKFEINKLDEEFLIKLIDANRYNIRDYLEYQLFGHFISPLLNRVYFYGENYRQWFQPELSGIVNGKKLYGKPDFMVASGVIEPKKPYFFIQEFKKEKINSDPLRQVLAEMTVAIEINKNKKNFGAYNIGKLWAFIILEKLSEGKYQYYESESFDCLKINDLKQIYINLQAVKHKYYK